MNTRLIAILFFLVCMIRVNGQEDSSLNRRLEAVLVFTEKQDFEKVLDYTYPKLFKLVPRDKMLELMSSIYDNDEFGISVDSVRLIKKFPVFNVDGESFTKIRHSMRMKMKFKAAADTSDAKAVAERQEMATLMESGFGEGNVRYDKLADALIINDIAHVVAVKTKEDNQWYFVNLDEDNPSILNFLFSKPVIDKLATYQ